MSEPAIREIRVAYDLPTPESEPHGLAIGPDGALHVAPATGGVAVLSRGQTS